ncbi:MAG TPA: nickel-dependent hydrogenase large subunit [Thermodesulfobacteriota bacterium]|nr:nickel-dependent hydrogenase large subunit [Thermodesulfobacteriota bacterium]HNU73066.1 nickel-dependent hydrogenase large subunit [Thermodesulfobacteriota bacterium]HOC38036.1 nickel-dependent hydrogenase large subunit [Thermodesulfobacteriota bacterium]
MAQRNVIPFGPQHPVLLEPIHFDLVTEDEKVVDAIPSFSYVHRGLERLVEKRDFHDYVHIADRICGLCSIQHAMGYCQAVEAVMEVEVPARALYLRTIWAELGRLHSHLFWLGIAADAFGYESLFMQALRHREVILNLIEETTGGRIIFSACKVGGVRRDITSEALQGIVSRLTALSNDLHQLAAVFTNDYSIKHRLVDVGYISREDAYTFGCVGPLARASGLAMDMRTLGYAAYGELEVEPMVEEAGDCYARCLVRIREIFQSIDLIRQAIPKVPDGPIDIKVKGTPVGEYFSRVEQPRGEVIHYVKGNGAKFLQRFRVRVPTFTNIPAMIKMLRGSQLADVPNIIITLDPCISCTER